MEFIVSSEKHKTELLIGLGKNIHIMWFIVSSEECKIEPLIGLGKDTRD